MDTSDAPSDFGATARNLAGQLQKVMNATIAELDADNPATELLNRVTAHLNTELQYIVVVAEEFENWEHASLQRGVDAFVSAQDGRDLWFGLAGGHRGHEELIDMLTMARRHGAYELGSVDLTTAAVGPDETDEVVQFGMVAAYAPSGAPVIIGVRRADDRYGRASCKLEVLAPDRTVAIEVRDAVYRLVREHDVLRGNVVAFGTSEHRGNELLTFLPRPQLTGSDVVLPDGVLDTIERHVVGIAEQSDRLLAAGQHLKRGLLLHGPPGTGKTHTVRYLMGKLSESSVIVLTGMGMRFIGKAAALARRLQPSVLVLEDVDLVGQDRSHTPMGNPLLFSLLDAMDGIGSDADVTFVLTTNRAKDLENALADRPGRVDLAVEIPRPDAAGREQLLRLYGGGVTLDADLGPIVAATEGVTASYIKELIRRATLSALRRDGQSGDGQSDTVRLDERAMADALTEMNDSSSTLTRSLLGSSTEPA